MKENLGIDEFWEMIGRPKIRWDFSSMSVDELYERYYPVMCKAAELYSMLYCVDKDELLSECNVCFVECIEGMSDNKNHANGHYTQDIKRRLNARLYAYCKREMKQADMVVSFRDITDYLSDEYTKDYLDADVISASMQRLDERQKGIIDMYFYQGHNQDYIGKKFGISKARVSSILGKSLRICKTYIKCKSPALASEHSS